MFHESSMIVHNEVNDAKDRCPALLKEQGRVREGSEVGRI